MVIHPFLFAIYPILFLFAFNIDVVSPEEIVLPILITLLVAVSLWISLSFILKNQYKSGFIVSLGLILFFSYGHSYILFEEFSGELISHIILGSIFLIIFIIGTYFFIRIKNKLNKVTTIVNVVAISLIAISFINIGTYYSETNYFFEPEGVEIDYDVEKSKNVDVYPDIYAIILDEYADSDMLMKYLDFDNQEFISFLEERGFHVASESYSNYPKTRSSIPSTLDMDYLHLKTDERGVLLTNDGLLYLTSNNQVMKHLKSKGYIIVNISSGNPPIKYLDVADYWFCNYKDELTSEFFTLLIHTSMINPLNVYLVEAKREQILCGFKKLTNLDDISEKPKFVFAHFKLPHQPYVFGPNGESTLEFSTVVMQTEKDWIAEKYLNQLQFANKKMKVVIEKLLSEEDPPVIIIFSDHGFRHGGSEKGTKEFLQKRFNNFKAYYFPDKERNSVLEETTNVNIFRILFNLYFNDNFEILDDRVFMDDRVFVSQGGKVTRFNYTDVTHILFSNP